MKPLHLVCSFDNTGSKAFHYIQVIRGKVIATNKFVLVVLPVSEVFNSEDIIDNEEELYFEASLWKTSGIFKSKDISREGNIFTGSAGSGNIFQIKALSKDEFLEATNGSKYPDVRVVFPQTEQIAIKSAVIDPEAFKTVCKIFGVGFMQTCFYGEDRPMLLLPNYSDGIALIATKTTVEALEKPLDFDVILGLKEPKPEETNEVEESWEELL